jgi:hypothetical protein
MNCIFGINLIDDFGFRISSNLLKWMWRLNQLCVKKPATVNSMLMKSSRSVNEFPHTFIL